MFLHLITSHWTRTGIEEIRGEESTAEPPHRGLLGRHSIGFSAKQKILLRIIESKPLFQLINFQLPAFVAVSQSQLLPTSCVGAISDLTAFAQLVWARAGLGVD